MFCSKIQAIYCSGSRERINFNLSNFNLNFYSVNVFLEPSDIALKEMSLGMYLIKDIPTPVLRKARVLRLLGSTVNYTQ